MGLKIDPSSVRSISNNLDSYVGELQSALSTIKSNNETLAQAWIGTDASAFTNNIEQSSNDIQKLIDSIQSVSSFLTSAANNYENIQNDNASQLSQ